MQCTRGSRPVFNGFFAVHAACFENPLSLKTLEPAFCKPRNVSRSLPKLRACFFEESQSFSLNNLIEWIWHLQQNLFSKNAKESKKAENTLSWHDFAQPQSFYFWPALIWELFVSCLRFSFKLRKVEYFKNVYSVNLRSEKSLWFYCIACREVIDFFYFSFSKHRYLNYPYTSNLIKTLRHEVENFQVCTSSEKLRFISDEQR